ncbi:unnamed protein product [Meganyctiphanes norvegica]|uniref:GDP-fucose protein O-fucosyltransferase 1 n=1 Tax=Meganyctiphanes norvegica TaxID=48144 RepID=A0AAV2Q4B5_MEGNR
MTATSMKSSTCSSPHYLIAFYVLYAIFYGPKATINDIEEANALEYLVCLGRFGNQADHFLGAVAFAKGLDRTLVLPPWVEYRPGEVRSTQIPFDTYFKVEALALYLKVITMHEFMKEIATTLWPQENRIAFCYMARYNSEGCNAKEGNPFGPFWDTYDIDFVGSEMYRPLGYDTRYNGMAEKWNDKYPPEKWPVLAFTGAPASFPVQKDNRGLHKYLKWSDSISKRAESFIKTLPRGPFVGIHMRNGIDWARACEHVEHSPNLFAAPQCLGYRNENGNATQELCMPSRVSNLSICFHLIIFGNCNHFN